MKSTQALGYRFGYRLLGNLNGALLALTMANDVTKVVDAAAEGKMNSRAYCDGALLFFLTVTTLSANPPLMAAGAISYSAYKIVTLVIDLYYGE